MAEGSPILAAGGQGSSLVTFSRTPRQTLEAHLPGEHHLRLERNQAKVVCGNWRELVGNSVHCSFGEQIVTKSGMNDSNFLTLRKSLACRKSQTVQIPEVSRSMMLVDSALCPLAAAGILAPQSSRSRSYLAEACFLAAALCLICLVEVLSLDRLLKERDLLSVQKEWKCPRC